MPETEESATDFVLGGDTRLVELREALARAEERHDQDLDNAELGMEIAHLPTPTWPTPASTMPCRAPSR